MFRSRCRPRRARFGARPRTQQAIGGLARRCALEVFQQTGRSGGFGGSPDPIKTNGRWVEQMKPGSGSFNGPETMSYEYRGVTANGLLVFVAAYSGGGSGRFYYLHILDAASAGALDEDGSTYSRLNLTLVRTYVLGDRWQASLVIPFASSPTQALVAMASRPLRSKREGLEAGGTEERNDRLPTNGLMSADTDVVIVGAGAGNVWPEST